MKPAVLLCLIRGCEPLARALLERFDVELLAFYPHTSQLLQEAGIPHRVFDDFITAQNQHAIVDSLPGRYKAAHDGFMDGRARADWSEIDDQTWNLLRRAVLESVQQDFGESMVVIDALRRCASTMDLRLVIVPEDMGRDTRTAVVTADRLGIPSLHILHGYFYGAVTCDVTESTWLAAFSEPLKETYVRCFGARPERVVVTGNPAWDRYAQPPAPRMKEEVCARLGLDPGRPVVSYALTTPASFSMHGAAYHDHHIKTAEIVVDAFIELSRKHPTWQFVLRPHPGHPHTCEALIERANTQGLERIVLDTDEPEHALAAVDVLLCTQSNLGIEAILWDIPVVDVALDDVAQPLYDEGLGRLFGNDDAVLQVREAEGIGAAVEAALTDSATLEALRAARPRSIRHFNYANDGQAMARICDLAGNILEGNVPPVSPVDRFPEFELPMARAVPEGARRIAVVGRGAAYAAGALRYVHDSAEVCVVSLDGEGCRNYDAVVLAAPLPHDACSADRLAEAAALLADDGCLVFPARNGASREALRAFSAGEWCPANLGAEPAAPVGQFSMKGLEVVLSRADLEADAITAIDYAVAAVDTMDGEQVMAWVVCARPAERGAGDVRAQEDHVARARAEKANRRGEQLFAEGDIQGALAEFAVAVQACGSEALFYNNLATGLHVLGMHDHAWHRIREAFHLNPAMPSVRDNMRAIAGAVSMEQEAEDLLALFGEEAAPGA